jgi:hypothetical protein
MRAMMNRLRRLENATAPVEQKRADFAAILRSIGDDESMTFPAESFAGCRGTADRMLRIVQLMDEYEERHPRVQGDCRPGQPKGGIAGKSGAEE